jgi:hypothetical protein
VERLKEELEIVDSERNALKAEMRKLKRKEILTGGSECEICKMRVAVPNGKAPADKLKTVDLEEIIRETEKLNASNKKI